MNPFRLVRRDYFYYHIYIAQIKISRQRCIKGAFNWKIRLSWWILKKKRLCVCRLLYGLSHLSWLTYVIKLHFRLVGLLIWISLHDFLFKFIFRERNNGEFHIMLRKFISFRFFLFFNFVRSVIRTAIVLFKWYKETFCRQSKRINWKFCYRELKCVGKTSYQKSLECYTCTFFF